MISVLNLAVLVDMDEIVDVVIEAMKRPRLADPTNFVWAVPTTFKEDCPVLGKNMDGTTALKSNAVAFLMLTVKISVFWATFDMRRFNLVAP